MSVIFDGDEIFVFDITVNVSNSVQEISLMAKVTNLDGSNVSNILDVSQYLISVNTDSYTLDINHFIFSDNIEVVSSLVNNREYEFVVRFLNAGEYTVDYNDNNYVGKCIIIVDAQYKFAELYRYIVLDDNGDMMAEDENGYHFAIGVDGYNNPYNKSATIIVSYDDILIDNAIFSLDNTEAYTLLGNKISVKNCGCANVVITVGEYTMNLKFVATKAIADSVTINYPSDVYYNEIKHLDIEIIADNAYNYIPDNAMIITTNGNVVIDGLSIEMLSYLPYINGYVIVGDNVIDFEIRVHRYRFSNIACIINGKEVDTIYVDSSPLKVELRYCVGENEIDLTTFDYFNVTVDCENFVLNTSNIKHYFYIVAIGSDEGTLTVRDEHNEVIFEIIIIAQKII